MLISVYSIISTFIFKPPKISKHTQTNDCEYKKCNRNINYSIIIIIIIIHHSFVNNASTFFNNSTN